MQPSKQDSPKISPGVSVTRRYPEFVSTDAVLSYLREVHMQLDTLAFNVRSTLNSIVTGAATTNATPEANAPAEETEMPQEVEDTTGNSEDKAESYVSI